MRGMAVISSAIISHIIWPWRSGWAWRMLVNMLDVARGIHRQVSTVRGILSWVEVRSMDMRNTVCMINERAND